MAEASLKHPEPLSRASYSAVELMPDDATVLMLDQRLLPGREVYYGLKSAEEVAEGIRDMIVRGAPAIGIAAAYAMVLAAREGRQELERAAKLLKAARPTAVNLAWAVDRMLVEAQASDADLSIRLAHAARKIHRDDVEACWTMGELGAAFIEDGATILTHCNAGALATGGYGTALGVIRGAHRAGKKIEVIADETRPYLQGARLTAWELARDGIPVRVITDGSSGFLFQRGMIDLAVVGADRIAANGDFANKVGTYTVACLAAYHERPLYVAAPWSTVDLRCPCGEAIPIEERASEEVTHFAGARVAADGAGAVNFSFDVTPGRLVRALITERGVASPLDTAGLQALAP